MTRERHDQQHSVASSFRSSFSSSSYFVQSPARVYDTTSPAHQHLQSRPEPVPPLVLYKWMPPSFVAQQVAPAARNILVTEQQQQPEPQPRNSRRWFLVGLVTAISVILCTAFSVWLVRRAYCPHFALQGGSFSKIMVAPLTNFSDASAAAATAEVRATSLLTLDTTLRVNLYNPSKYFPVHYEPMAFQLFYQGAPVAHGKLSSFTQSKNSRQAVQFKLRSVGVPLRESAGSSLQGSVTNGTPFLLVLKATMNARANLWGKLITRHYSQRFRCELLIDTIAMEVMTSSCT